MQPNSLQLSHHEKNAQKNEERGVIPSPLVFRPLTMLKVQIDFLRGDAEVDELRGNGKLTSSVANKEIVLTKNVFHIPLEPQRI